MAISGIGYTQTYYYDASTGKFTSGDKAGEAIADSLNEEKSPVQLADFESRNICWKHSCGCRAKPETGGTDMSR